MIPPVKANPPPWRLALLVAVSLVAMATVDFLTGQELVFSCAYLLPVSLAAWWFGRRWVLPIAIVSGITAYVVDELDGYAFSHPGIEYWNAFTCFLIALVTGLVLARLKRVLSERERTNQELQKALDELNQSANEILRLQEGLQTMCAWTKRIKVGDHWMTPEDFLTKRLNLKISHGISPEALTGILSEAEAHLEQEHGTELPPRPQANGVSALREGD